MTGTADQRLHYESGSQTADLWMHANFYSAQKCSFFAGYPFFELLFGEIKGKMQVFDYVIGD